MTASVSDGKRRSLCLHTCVICFCYILDVKKKTLEFGRKTNTKPGPSHRTSNWLTHPPAIPTKLKKKVKDIFNLVRPYNITKPDRKTPSGP